MKLRYLEYLIYHKKIEYMWGILDLQVIPNHLGNLTLLKSVYGEIYIDPVEFDRWDNPHVVPMIGGDIFIHTDEDPVKLDDILYVRHLHNYYLIVDLLVYSVPVNIFEKFIEVRMKCSDYKGYIPTYTHMGNIISTREFMLSYTVKREL